MARLAAELVRRQSLIDAAVHLIGEQGSLDVSVKEIATRAGMSPALAFHYFGAKDAMIVETMRHLLREFSAEARREMSMAANPRQRLEALIQASFGPAQFDRRTIAAWLVFYLRSHSSPQARRLLQVYQGRLRSNLTAAFRRLLPDADARTCSEMLGALIDGLYIRHALRSDGPNAAEAIGLCRAWLANAIGADQERIRS